MTSTGYYYDDFFYEESMQTLFGRRDKEKALLGTVFGQAVADALGAPFEFGAANRYSECFGGEPVLTGTGEMIGGGAFNWRPGEFTDDTQMALIGISAIVENYDRFSEAFAIGTKNKIDDAYDHFLSHLYDMYRTWAKTAADVGSTTRGSLSHHDYRLGAKAQHERTGFSASNGCIMRLGPMIASFVGNFDELNLEDVLRFSESQTRLTHWDDDAVDASLLMASIMYKIYDSVQNDSFPVGTEAELLASIVDDLSGEFHNEALGMVFGFRDSGVVLNGPTNGKAITCLAQAVWAVCSTSSFEDAIVKTINIGGDTDTVAAVAGAIAGALYGVDSIPSRWITNVNGVIPGTEFGHMGYDELNSVIHDWVLFTNPDELTRFEPAAGPQLLDENFELYAANLPGVASCDDDSFHLISLCRTGSLTKRFKNRRNYFIIDTVGANPHLETTVKDAVDTIDAWLDSGKKVVVHCHAGRSRTGFILKAWYMRRYGVSHAEAHIWLADRWKLYDQFGNTDFTKFLDDFTSLPV
jgi:ADP-ribosyl-[dinitrogen reductase] hydrolase